MNACPVLPFGLPTVCDSTTTFLLYVIPVAVVAVLGIGWSVGMLILMRRYRAADAAVAAETDAARDWWQADTPLKPRALATAQRQHDRIVARAGVVTVDTATVELAVVLPPAALVPPEFVPAPVALDLDQPADPITPVETTDD